MNVRMELLSDAIFGSGQSVPGGEDIAVKHDREGFPYLSGSTLRGILREELENLMAWTEAADGAEKLEVLFGRQGIDQMDAEVNGKLEVSSFTLPASLRRAVREEKEGKNPEKVLEFFTAMRTFTALEEGSSKEGTLRNARCIKRGLIFEGTIYCPKEAEAMVREGLSYVKWVGTMRSRGFGMVSLTEIGGKRI